jgi:hypothetical protein
MARTPDAEIALIERVCSGEAQLFSPKSIQVQFRELQTVDLSEAAFIASNASNLDTYCWCEAVREHCSTASLNCRHSKLLARAPSKCAS